MKIHRIDKDKKRYLPLLLLGDEQESMIDRYLERGELYVMEDDQPCAVCVVTDEGDAKDIQYVTGVDVKAGETDIVNFQ